MQADLKTYLQVSYIKSLSYKEREKRREDQGLFYESLYKSFLPISKLYTERVQEFSFRTLQRLKKKLAKVPRGTFLVRKLQPLTIQSLWQNYYYEHYTSVIPRPSACPPNDLNYAKSHIYLVTLTASPSRNLV